MLRIGRVAFRTTLPVRNKMYRLDIGTAYYSRTDLPVDNL
jgi:hypothetical protein